MATHSQIIGSGFVTGEHCITNEKMCQMVDTSDAWIRERTGIEQRYMVEHGTTTTDLALRASQKAIADAGIKQDDIDYVVFATMTPDYYFPGCGGLLVRKLGLKRSVPALDIRQQCTGFLFGLQTCDALLKSGMAKTILLVGAEVHSVFFPWPRHQWEFLFGRSDVPPTKEEHEWSSQFRDRAVLFGDAAGAVILRSGTEEGCGIIDSKLFSDGDSFEDLYVPTGGAAQRPYMSHEALDAAQLIPVMNGKSVFRRAVTLMPQAIAAICDANKLSLDDIALVLPHQANLRINLMIQKVLGLPDDRIFNNIQRYGNTTAATLPIAYDECVKSGRIKQGDLVCFVGLGAGFHWGAVLYRQ